MTAAPPRDGLGLRNLLPVLVLDIACPYVAYHFLRQQVPRMSPSLALLLSGVFPVLNNVRSLVRGRTLDIIGVVILVGIVVGAASAFVTGDPKLLLIRESFVTGALAVVCLASLVWPRPLLFFIGRDFSAGHDPARVAEFNAMWERPGAQRVFRVMTVVWGLGWLAEFALKIVLVLVLTIPQVLVVGPIESNGITIALILWTIRYANESRRRGEEAQRAELLAAPRT
ncbi:MAG TPA: VC0807 family protein [bacterium]|nr:VC0807 family protein [bacterium]